MSRLFRKSLWQELQRNELVAGEVPVAGENESPWYVRTMLGIAGWIGSLFLLGFVGVGFSFVMESALAALVFGVMVSGGAFALFNANRHNDFMTQLGLAIGLAGQVLLIFGLHELSSREDAMFFGSVFVVEAILTILMPNFIYRVMTSLAAMVALAFALRGLGMYGIASGLTAFGFALVWLQDLRWGRFDYLWRPAGYGVALSMLVFHAGLLWGRGLWWSGYSKGPSWLQLYAPWLGRMMVAAVFLTVVFVLLKRMQIAMTSKTSITVFVGAIVVMTASFQAPGVAIALLILVVGFAVNNPVLLGCGFFAFGGFLSNYYYTMETTLLAKSMLLLALGAVLLAGRLAMRQWLAPSDTGGTDHA